MSEFTPGPWKVHPEENRENNWDFWVEQVENSTPVAKCYTPYNANLVSAAPDMYEVLKQYEEFEAELIMDNEAWQSNWLPQFTQHLYDKWMEIQAKRNDAIIKADGGIK